MIMYKFGEVECKISFKDFLAISTTILPKKLKKEFKTFYDLYEFIELYKKEITHILFDGYEYTLEKGLLHNLYGSAYIRYDEDGFMPGPKRFFYIDGKLVCEEMNNRCSKLENFQTKDIHFFVEITGKLSEYGYRRIKGRDYNIYPINLKHRIKIDQRKKKLQRLNDIPR